MSSFRKKTLIALLFASSGPVSAFGLSELPPITQLPPVTQPPSQAQSSAFSDIEILSSKPNVKTSLSFENQGDYVVSVKVNYKRKTLITNVYSDKKEEFKLEKDSVYTMNLKGDDAFVEITTSISNEAKTLSKLFSVLKLCSFNNKFFSTNEVPQVNRKNITFLGSDANPAIMFPDLSNQGYMSAALDDTKCWELESPDNLIIYEHSYNQGLSKIISNDIPDLGEFNNHMSSYLIPKGWVITFYERKNYLGKKYTRRQSSGFDKDLNDKIRSIKISK